MGDRCYVEVIARKEDKQAFEEIGFIVQEEPNETHGHPQLVKLVDEEANWAHYDDLMALASKGIVFYGNHGAGCNYPSGEFASNGKRYAQVITADGQPVVPIDSQGRPSKAAVANAKRYLSVLRATREILGLERRRTRRKPHHNAHRQNHNTARKQK